MTYLILTFLLDRQGWKKNRNPWHHESPVNGCVFTQSHEVRVTENGALLCILPLQRTHTDCVHVWVHTQVQLFATPWTVATRPLCPQYFPGKNTGVGCRFLLQGSSWPGAGSNLHLLSSSIGRQILYLFVPWKPSYRLHTGHILATGKGSSFLPSTNYHLNQGRNCSGPQMRPPKELHTKIILC